MDGKTFNSQTDANFLRSGTFEEDRNAYTLMDKRVQYSHNIIMNAPMLSDMDVYLPLRRKTKP